MPDRNLSGIHLGVTVQVPHKVGLPFEQKSLDPSALNDGLYPSSKGHSKESGTADKLPAATSVTASRATKVAEDLPILLTRLMVFKRS